MKCPECGTLYDVHNSIERDGKWYCQTDGAELNEDDLWDKTFLIIETAGGTTSLPDTAGLEQQVENCQVLFFGQAENANDAMEKVKFQLQGVDLDRLHIQIREIKILQTIYKK